jgi:hypothetical protein
MAKPERQEQRRQGHLYEAFRPPPKFLVGPGEHSRGPGKVEAPSWERPAWVRDGWEPDGWSEKVVRLYDVHEGAPHPLGHPAFIRHRERMERHLKDALNSRQGRQLFIHRYFGIHLERFHEDMLELAWSGGQVVELVPTEHGKSTLLAVWFPLLSLANDPNLPHTVCCVNEPEAILRLKAQRHILETNHDLIRDYPWLARPRRGTWGAREYNVDGRDGSQLSPSMWACGRGNGSIKGHRALTVFDDLEGKRSRDHAAYREDLKQWFWTEAIRAIHDPGDCARPLLLAAGTPYDVDSFYFDLAEREDWKLFRQPYRWPDGSLIWKKKSQKVELFKKTMKRDEFAIAMELDPKGGDSSVLTMKEIVERTAQLRPLPQDEAGTIQTLDPGTGIAGADYAGTATVRWYWPLSDQLPYFNVYNPRVLRRDIYDQCQACRRECARWGGISLVYEVNGRQRYDYSTTFARFAPEVKLVEHYTNDMIRLDHHHGLSVIKTMVQRNRMAIYADQGDEEAEEGKKQLQAEVRDFGKTKDDHLMAALWFVFMHAYNQVAQTRRAGLKPNLTTDSEGRLQVAGRTYGPSSGAGLYFGGAPAAGQRNVRRFHS